MQNYKTIFDALGGIWIIANVSQGGILSTSQMTFLIFKGVWRSSPRKFWIFDDLGGISNTFSNNVSDFERGVWGSSPKKILNIWCSGWPDLKHISAQKLLPSRSWNGDLGRSSVAKVPIFILTEISSPDDWHWRTLLQSRRLVRKRDWLEDLRVICLLWHMK